METFLEGAADLIEGQRTKLSSMILLSQAKLMNPQDAVTALERLQQQLSQNSHLEIETLIARGVRQIRLGWTMRNGRRQLVRQLQNDTANWNNIQQALRLRRENVEKKSHYAQEIDLVRVYLNNGQEDAAKQLASELYNSISNLMRVQGYELLYIKIIELLFIVREVDKAHQLTHQFLKKIYSVSEEIINRLLSTIPEDHQNLRAIVYLAKFKKELNCHNFELLLEQPFFQTALNLAEGNSYLSLDIIFTWTQYFTKKVTQNHLQLPSITRLGMNRQIQQLCQAGVEIDVLSTNSDVASKQWLFRSWLQVLSPDDEFDWRRQMQQGQEHTSELNRDTLHYFSRYAVSHLIERGQYINAADVGRNFSRFPGEYTALYPLYSRAIALATLEETNPSPEELLKAFHLEGVDDELQQRLLTRAGEIGDHHIQWVISLLTTPEAHTQTEEYWNPLFEDPARLTQVIHYTPHLGREQLLSDLISETIKRTNINSGQGNTTLLFLLRSRLVVTDADIAAVVEENAPATRNLLATLFYLLSNEYQRQSGDLGSDAVVPISYAHALATDNELKVKIELKRLEVYTRAGLSAINHCEHANIVSETSSDESSSSEEESDEPENVIIETLNPLLRNFPEDESLKDIYVDLLCWKCICLYRIGNQNDALELKETILNLLRGNYSHLAKKLRARLLQIR